MSDGRAAAIPPVAKELAGLFAERGHKIFLVGGWVRDALLGIADADLDFATDSRPPQTLEILRRWAKGRVWTTGQEFGTVGAERDYVRVEVTTFRQEVYRDDSRNPEVVYADDLQTDLSRRDFTMNAIAIALPDVEIVDPFDGMGDIGRKLIRTPLEPEISFSDDPLRMLRALRFASTLGFEVDPAVLRAISEMKGRLAIVSAERIRDEIIKLMLGARPWYALGLAAETGLSDEFLPELGDLKLEQDPVHQHKDVFAHTLAVLRNACEADRDDPDLILRLGALFHDIGKPKTRRYTDEGVTFHHHEVVGADMVEKRLKELRFPAKVVDAVRELVYLHMRLHTYRFGWSDKAVRRYVRDAGPLLGELNTLVRADCTTRNPERARRLSKRIDELEARIADLAAREELTKIRPALDGNQVMTRLGIQPGPHVGKALDFLMEIRMEEGEISEEEAYRRLDGWWAEQAK